MYTHMYIYKYIYICICIYIYIEREIDTTAYTKPRSQCGVGGKSAGPPASPPWFFVDCQVCLCCLIRLLYQLLRRLLIDY